MRIRHALNLKNILKTIKKNLPTVQKILAPLIYHLKLKKSLKIYLKTKRNYGKAFTE